MLDGISPHNRGLAYGDGLFETMRVQGRNIPLLSRHMERLTAGLQRLGIPMPDRSLESFLLDCCRDTDAGVLKLVVTRGEGGRGYLPPEDVDPVIIVSLHPLPSYPADFCRDGLAIGVSSLRIGKNPLLAGMKHLNRLEQVLIRKDLHDAGFIEGLVLNEEDLVVEGAFSNIFVIADDTLMTPLLHSAGVAGVLRGWLLENAPLMGLATVELNLDLPSLLAAEEIFLCNSVNGLWPVTSLGARQWAIGRWTRALQQAYATLLD